MKLSSIKKYLPTIGIVLALILSVAALAATGYSMKKLPVSDGSNKVLGQLTEMYNSVNAGYLGLNDRMKRVEQSQVTKPQASAPEAGKRLLLNEIEQEAIASEQYIKDNTRILGDRVGFRPGWTQFIQEWRISRSLWDRYPTKDIQITAQDIGSYSFSLVMKTNPRSYSHADPALTLVESQIGWGAYKPEPADCDQQKYSENHRRAVSYFTNSVDAAGCGRVKEVTLSLKAGCSFYSADQTSAPGDKAYLFVEPAKLPENEDERWYGDAVYANAKLLMIEPYYESAAVMEIAAGNSGRFSSEQEEKKMKADWQLLLNDIIKHSVSGYMDEYGACY
ncbi:hypothetical protein IT087_02135 [Candidatus Uhrbacteria bacterium]|nr:hypothetical protein [Candidatus Uhrbacteria bacterium]